MNIGTLLKAFDTFMAVRDVARRVKGGAPPPTPADTGMVQSPGSGIGGQLEARLTNVVMAALKEAFDRDHARLELERAQLDEQRRRAEEAMRQELRRQAADRELARLRMLSATALVGWIAAVLMLLMRLAVVTVASKAVMAGGWVLLLAALATAFSAQARVSEAVSAGGDTAAAARSGTIAVWLLTAGLPLAAGSIMF
jgi:hypothetical protein